MVLIIAAVPAAANAIQLQGSLGVASAWEKPNATLPMACITMPATFADGSSSEPMAPPRVFIALLALVVLLDSSPTLSFTLSMPFVLTLRTIGSMPLSRNSALMSVRA